MRLNIILVVLIAGLHSLYGQNANIDWSQLNGKWECEQVLLVNKYDPQAKDKDSIDISTSYKPYFQSYEGDLIYGEEYPYPGNYTTMAGKYKIDKITKKISYSSMVQTTKFSGGKVAVPDLVFNWVKQDLVVLRLTENFLVVLQQYNPDSESVGDYIFYMRRVN